MPTRDRPDGPPEAPLPPINPPPPSLWPEPTPPPGVSGHRLALYKYDACPYCRRVQRTIDQLGIGDLIEMRDTWREPQWRADLLKKTGRSQVPCLFIDGEPMFESADISAWLREHHA